MASLYGIVISASIATAILVANYFAKKDKKNTDHVWGLAFYTIISGLIGARIYHVLDYFEYYERNPLNILVIQNGGLGIIGGIIGGILGIFWYTRVHKLDVVYWLDLAAVVTPLAQSIARWGNFFNQELFGYPTNLPWGLNIPINNRPEGYEKFERFHPLFLYESMLDFILFIFLVKNKAKFKFPGQIIIFYLMGYSVIRFFLESLRIDPWRVYGFPVAQLICMLFIFLGVILNFRLTNNKM